MKDETPSTTTLMHAEEYLDMMSHDAAKAEVFAAGEPSLYEWYEDGVEAISELINNLPLYVNEVAR